MNLLHVPADKLYGHWSFVRHGLLEIADKTLERDLPEDVYLSLKQGKSWLYLIQHGGDNLGFMVFQVEADPDCPCLFVWKIWSEPGALEVFEQQIWAEVERLAGLVKARRVRMKSPRKGWARHGFELAGYVYEREL